MNLLISYLKNEQTLLNTRRSMKYCRLEIFMQQCSLLVNSFTTVHFKCTNLEIIWVVKIRNTSEYLGHNTPLGHPTDRGPVGLGQYDSLGEYCGPHTASSVFLIVLFQCNISLDVR